MLFLILGTRLGVDLSLAAAPLHLFVRCRIEGGPVVNLETTSGALPARDAWFRQIMPMSGLALANGLYMRSMSRTEAIAAMASTVLEHLIGGRRWAEAIAAGEAVLEHSPNDAYVLVKLGTAYGGLLQAEFLDRYPSPFLIPPLLRPRYAMLAQRNRAAFEAAEALGWEEVE